MTPSLPKDIICASLLHSNNGIIITDPDEIILFWNKGAEKALGFTMEETAHKKLSRFPVESMNAEGDFLSIHKKILNTQAAVNAVSTVKSPRVSPVTLAINATPVPLEENGEGKIGCVFVFTDISEFIHRHTEMEKNVRFLEGYLAKINETQKTNMRLMKEIVFQKKEIRDLNRRLEEANETILNALENISHEILSPLANIIGFASLIRGEKNIPRHQLDDNLDIMERAGRRIQRMAERMLDVAKLEAAVESGTFPLTLGLVDINRIIIESLDEQEFSLSRKKHRMEARLEKKPLEMTADQEMISEAMSNLISNAIKYTPENGNILVESKDEGEWIRIRVKDNGIGIPEDEIHKIFKRFHRITGSQESSISGIGIGLSLVKSIVDLHGGTILVSSRLQQGTVFDINLPKIPPKRSMN